MHNIISFICYSFIIVFLFSIDVKGQEYYYDYGKKIPVEVSNNQIIVKFKNSITEQQINAVFENEPVLKQSTKLKSTGKYFHKLQLNQTDDIDQIVKHLKLREEIEIANRVYINALNKSELLFGDRFVVQFKPEVSESEIDNFNRENNVEVITKNVYPNRYTLKIPVDSKSSLLAVVKKYYDTFPAEYAIPDFLVEFQLHGIPNDKYFNYQYYLTKTNVPYAWDITLGSSAITVALIDDGGEVHPDLPSSRIVQGYDFKVPDTNPLYNDPNDPPMYSGRNSYHGIACAGIIAATRNNNIGVAGIAPNCKIMYVRIAGDDEAIDTYYYSPLVDAIDYAWKHGADVISNSWGILAGPHWSPYDENSLPYKGVSDACHRAMTQGRNGKGCVVVASLGNNGQWTDNYIQCPANVQGVISVGAIDINDQHLDYSPGGSLNPDDPDAVDVVACSGDLSVDGGYDVWGCNNGIDHDRVWPKENIWTLDRAGLPGRIPGNYNICQSPYGWAEFRYDGTYNSPLTTDEKNDSCYTSRFAGTSAACPQVSGLAALILSINPNLISSQVSDIITSTAEGVTSGFDDYTGWGRINTNRAVLCARYGISSTNILANPTIFDYITQNTLVRGTINVTDDLIVDEGVNLVIEDGSTVNIASGKRITVYGAIIAKNATFQKNGTDRWYGIDVTGTGNGSYIKYCTIKDGDYGILIGGSKYIYIYHNDIRGFVDAISIYEDGNPEIYDCYIQGGSEADILSTGDAAGKVYNSQLSGTTVYSSGHKNMGNAATLFDYYGSGRNILKARYGTTVLVLVVGYFGFLIHLFSHCLGNLFSFAFNLGLS